MKYAKLSQIVSSSYARPWLSGCAASAAPSTARAGAPPRATAGLLLHTPSGSKVKVVVWIPAALRLRRYAANRSIASSRPDSGRWIRSHLARELWPTLNSVRPALSTRRRSALNSAALLNSSGTQV